MKRGIYFGIDFGTSNSSVAYVRDDPREASAMRVSVEAVPFDLNDGHGTTSPRCPTVVAADVDTAWPTVPMVGWPVFGRLKKKGSKVPLLRHGVSLFASIKSDLGTAKLYPRSAVPGVATPQHAAAVLFKHLRSAASAHLAGRDIAGSPVIVTVPASLGAAAREATRAAAVAAGFDGDRLEFIDEPIAALVDLLNSGSAVELLDDEQARLIAVYDYGGGTLDVSLVSVRFDQERATGLRVENIAISPYARLGSDLIDRAVMAEVLWPQIEAHSGRKRGAFDPQSRRKIEDTLTPTVARSLKEKMCNEVRRALEPPEDASARGDWVRAASSVKFVTQELKVDSPDLPPRYSMEFGQFDAIMDCLLSEDPSDNESLLWPLLVVLAQGRTSPADLHAVVLHGGGCRNPWVRRRLDQLVEKPGSLFGRTAILETPDLDASVARGAAIACYWKHARGVEYVRPVVAEDVGIVTLGQRSHRLVPGGAPLPYPDDHSYQTCSDFRVPRDGMRRVTVPWYMGRDERIVGSVTLDLPAGLKAGTPFAIKLRIDADKRLSWFYQVGKGEPVPAPALPDPWTPRPPTPEQRRLLNHRRQMEQRQLSDGRIPATLEVEEARQLWLCRDVDDLELLLADLGGEELKPAERAAVENYLGLIACWRGRSESAAEHFKKAAELMPTDATYPGNLGHTLAELGRFDEAISQMRLALQRDKDLLYLYEQLAFVARKRGDEAGACRELSEAAAVAERRTLRWPDWPGAWKDLARVRRALGHYEQATEAEGRASRLGLDERFGGDHSALLAGPDGRPAR